MKGNFAQKSFVCVIMVNTPFSMLIQFVYLNDLRKGSQKLFVECV
jgi:hypothetical protein